MKRTLLPILCAATLAAAVSCGGNPENTTADAVADTQPRLPAMHYADSTRNGRKISKDPPRHTFQGALSDVLLDGAGQG